MSLLVLMPFPHRRDAEFAEVFIYFLGALCASAVKKWFGIHVNTIGGDYANCRLARIGDVA
jgi:hypothetical protein